MHKVRWPKAVETSHLPRIPLDDEIAALSSQVLYTPELRKEYNDMFYAAKINPAQLELVKRRAQVIRDNLTRYEEVAKAVNKMPPILVAVIHQMECSGRFNAHLHNGDPLTARTTHVPKGRPKTGKPPFKWEFSAIDALRGMGFATVSSWDIPRMLYCLEAYNGFGYRLYHPEVKSPYLWSFTDMYRKGKYVADGDYDPKAISRQIGCVALMKAYTMIDKI